MVYHFRLILERSKDKNFEKMQKTSFWANFDHFYSKLDKLDFFLENQALSVFSSDKIFHSCKKSEKTNQPFLRKTVKRQMGGQTDRADIIGSSHLAKSKNELLAFVS